MTEAAEATAAETVLEFRDLHKEFRLGFGGRKRVHAVRGVSLSVRRSEIFGYLGPNGAGKTTTMKMALGLISVTSGEIELFGELIGGGASRRRVGFLPEQPHFHDYLSGREFLDFCGQLFGLDRAARERRGDELLELVGLADAGDRRLREYSKGMLQRLGVAQALVNDPDLVILDEPLSGLDPMGRKEVRDLVVSIRERGKTVFFSSHILHDIETICDRVAILIDGLVERVGPLAELLRGHGGRVDITALEVPEELAQRLRREGIEWTQQGGSHTFTAEEAAAGDVMRQLLDGGARVSHVQPRRESLEELFIRETARKGGDGGQ